jgi:hypothetical protein
MQQKDNLNQTLTAGQYQPYFYQSGKFLLYDSPSKKSSKSYLENSISKYDFTSDPGSKISYQSSQTVEDIVKRGYLRLPQAEPETAIISDKNQVWKMGLSDIISQIRNRYTIYHQNVYQLEKSKTDAVNSQLAIEASRGGVAMNSKEAYSLNKRITELYTEQLNERTRLWQDVSKLRQLLPENVENYLSSYRKLSILEDRKGDII